LAVGRLTAHHEYSLDNARWMRGMPVHISIQPRVKSAIRLAV